MPTQTLICAKEHAWSAELELVRGVLLPRPDTCPECGGLYLRILGVPGGRTVPATQIGEKSLPELAREYLENLDLTLGFEVSVSEPDSIAGAVSNLTGLIDACIIRALSDAVKEGKLEEGAGDPLCTTCGKVRTKVVDYGDPQGRCIDCQCNVTPTGVPVKETQREASMGAHLNNCRVLVFEASGKLLRVSSPLYRGTAMKTAAQWRISQSARCIRVVVPVTVGAEGDCTAYQIIASWFRPRLVSGWVPDPLETTLITMPKGSFIPLRPLGWSAT